MKYFITGATGFIGGEMARQLREAGHTVVALVRSPTKADKLAAMGVQLAQGDITEKENLRAPMQGADGVFHVAAWYKMGARDRKMVEAINIQGTRNVLEMMQELHIPKGVYTSTLAVYSDTRGRVVDENYRFDGKHLTQYDRTKWEAHYHVAVPLQQAGLPLVIVQPGLVYGPGDGSAMASMRRDYLKRRLPILPTQTTFCWGHVEDTARGHLLAMEKGKPGESYIIAGPPHTVIDAFELAERITGIPAPRLHAGRGMMRLMAAFMSIVGSVVPLPEHLTGEALRSGGGTSYTGSSAKAERELGFSARPLAEGLPETLAYEMKQLGITPRAPKPSRQPS